MSEKILTRKIKVRDHKAVRFLLNRIPAVSLSLGYNVVSKFYKGQIARGLPVPKKLIKRQSEVRGRAVGQNRVDLLRARRVADRVDADPMVGAGARRRTVGQDALAAHEGRPGVLVLVPDDPPLPVARGVHNLRVVHVVFRGRDGDVAPERGVELAVDPPPEDLPRLRPARPDHQEVTPGSTPGVGLPPGDVEALETLVQGTLRPDLTLLLDVDVETGRERAGLRGPEADRFEREETEFKDRVRNSYLALAGRHTDRIRIVDGTLPLTEVEDSVSEIMELFLDSGGGRR